MDLISHIASRDEFLHKMQLAQEQLQTLTHAVGEVMKRPKGPLLLYHHQSSTFQRVKELTLIIRRLYDNRVELLKNDVVEELASPKEDQAGGPYPPELQEILDHGVDVDNQIVLDFQTMLLFTGIALDDWAHMAGHVLGVDNPAKSSFDKIAKDDGKGPYAELWAEHKDGILWLDAFSRLYRNKMIVHRERPWQIGHSRSLYYLDWNLWTPVLPGWVSDERQEKIRQSLERVARDSGFVPKATLHELVFQLLERTASLNKDDRETVYEAAVELGFATPTFQEFAHRLADFLIAATATLTEIARADPARIDLGTPPR